MPKVLELVNYSALPEKVPIRDQTWVDSPKTRKSIIQFLKDGKDVDEIAELTGCRRHFIKKLQRGLEAEEDPSYVVVKAPKPIKVKPPRVVKWILMPCVICDKSFKAWPSGLEKGKKYCSVECYRVGRRKAKDHASQAPSQGPSPTPVQ